MSRENSETKRRFNVIDAIVIVLAILCIATICLRSQINNFLGIGERTSDYKLTFKVVAIRDSSSKYFEMNDDFWNKVYLDSPDIELGVISGILEKSAATEYMEDENGNPVAVRYPNSSVVDILGELKCNGVFKDDGCFYLAGKYVISPGDVLNVHTAGLDFSLVVVNIGAFEG